MQQHLSIPIPSSWDWRFEGLEPNTFYVKGNVRKWLPQKYFKQPMLWTAEKIISPVITFQSCVSWYLNGAYWSLLVVARGQPGRLLEDSRLPAGWSIDEVSTLIGEERRAGTGRQSWAGSRAGKIISQVGAFPSVRPADQKKNPSSIDDLPPSLSRCAHRQYVGARWRPAAVTSRWPPL